MIWYNLIPFGYFTNNKKNKRYTIPPSSQAMSTHVRAYIRSNTMLLSYYISTKPYYINSTIHGSLSYLPDHFSIFTCGSLHDISIFTAFDYISLAFVCKCVYACACACACAHVLVCNARPFHQLKLKYYSLFGKVLNYIYSFVYAN